MSQHPSAMKTPTALQQAGVMERQWCAGSLRLQELESAAILRLQSLDEPELLSAAMAGSGLSLPLDTGQAVGTNPACLCLRPREWMLFSESQAATELQRKFQALLDPRRTTLTNHSDGLAVFRLSGDGVPWLLSKLSCIDFLAESASGQHCVRTRMAHAAVLIHCHQPVDSALCFDLILERSIAKYLWTLLIDSSPHANELSTQFRRAP